MAFIAQTLIPEDVSACTNTGSVALGTRATVGSEEYVYCYNAGTTSALAGCFCVALSDTTGYSVSFASTAAVAIPFGVVRNTTVSAAQYFWLLKRGQTPLRGGTSDNTCVPGQFVIAMASGLFESGSGLMDVYYNSQIVIPNVIVRVSIETEAATLTGWGYVNFG
jgi:hypothetical protein